MDINIEISPSNELECEKRAIFYTIKRLDGLGKISYDELTILNHRRNSINDLFELTIFHAELKNLFEERKDRGFITR